MSLPYRLTAMPSSTEDELYRVDLDGEHAIFGGQFPGNPGLPGVYMLDMVKRVLEDKARAHVHFTELIRCKFMQPVRPTLPQPELILHVLTPSSGRVEASLLQDGVVAFKLTASYRA